jgi:hypothetical protein
MEESDLKKGWLIIAWLWSWSPTINTVIKFCAENLCFPYIYSNGVTVIYNPPVTGNISVEIKNTSLAHQEVGQQTLIFIRTLNSIFVKYSNLSIDCWWPAPKSSNNQSSFFQIAFFPLQVEYRWLWPRCYRYMENTGFQHKTWWQPYRIFQVVDLIHLVKRSDVFLHNGNL